MLYYPPAVHRQPVCSGSYLGCLHSSLQCRSLDFVR
ncbi:hypothetical protein BDFB_014845 [Asbolus verrucosus]|uniref:Uncharacterized protein n=1 Tax=Asbolus verrucosus TaxID=1661398 RepID=A0A482W2H2_ASBVE|nr:hypothetical protein BDFB_014845 [Asbolus verrucosus]